MPNLLLSRVYLVFTIFFSQLVLLPIQAAEPVFEDSFLVMLGSTYPETDPAHNKESHSIVGSGVLVDIPSIPRGSGRDHSKAQFVLTAAHLVQGENLWMKVGGSMLRPIVRKVDPENDTAVLEISDTGLPAAYQYDSRRQPGERFRPSADLARRIACIERREKACGPVASKMFFSGSERHRDLTIFANSWAAPGVIQPRGNLEFSLSSDQKKNLVTPTFDERHGVIPGIATPGNSGTLVADPSRNGRFVGIPVQYNYFFNESVIALPKAFEDMVASIRAGKSVKRSSVAKWKAYKGKLFLDFGDGTIDADWVRSEAGIALTGVPGNGVTAPPGNGVTAPPGNGVTAPPGRGCAERQNPGLAPLDQAEDLASLSKKLSQGPFLGDSGIEPGIHMRRLGVTPFMSRNGQRIYGFRALDRKTGRTITLYPNLEAYRWIRANRDSRNFSFEPLFQEPDAIELLREKLRIAGPAISGLSDDLIGAPFIGAQHQENQRWMTRHHGRGSVRVQGERIEIRWTWPRAVAKSLSAVNGQSYTELEHVSEEVTLSLDRKGRVRGSDRFEPIVKVTSNRGNQSYIDLRPLFYADLSATYQSSASVDWSELADSLRTFSGQMGLKMHHVLDDEDGHFGERSIEFHPADETIHFR